MAKKDDVEKISAALLLTAIENGGKKLDCFNGFLPRNYMRFGFIPVCKVPFNDEFAPENWNFERDGRPEIVFFRHNGDTVQEIMRKIKEKSYTTYDVDSIPVMEDYDSGERYRDEMMLESKIERKEGPNHADN